MRNTGGTLFVVGFIMAGMTAFFMLVAGGVGYIMWLKYAASPVEQLLSATTILFAGTTMVLLGYIIEKAGEDP